jgi:hypothetical protein
MRQMMKNRTIIQKQLPNLSYCILLDIIGYASFALPMLGEFSDLVWAPVSGFLFYKLFGGKMGLWGGGFSFLEEILPFTDFIPTFTIAWFIRKRTLSKEQTQPIRIESIEIIKS